jgi:hypothetical protein
LFKSKLIRNVSKERQFLTISQGPVNKMIQAKLKAQQKTIEALMYAAEQRTSEGPSLLELLSQNLSLERVVQQKPKSCSAREKS